jgi:hypothetical protein
MWEQYLEIKGIRGFAFPEFKDHLKFELEAFL